MKIILFDQWDKLVAMFKSMAGKAATEKSQYAINRVMPVEGRALLMDSAMNNILFSAKASPWNSRGDTLRRVLNWLCYCVIYEIV